jgi:hypothetical protein
MLKGIEKISLYTYYDADAKGVLLKGETANFMKSSERIISITERLKQLDARTVTYICSRPIKEEGNAISEPSGLGEPLEARRTSIIYNLLKSHDCHEGLFGSVPLGKSLSDRFIGLTARFAEQMFHYHSQWWQMLRNLRFLYKWIVFGKNDQLLSFLMREYVAIEKNLRDILSGPAQALQTDEQEQENRVRLKKICRKFAIDELVLKPILDSVVVELRQDPELTLGTLPQLINRIARKLNDETLAEDLRLLSSKLQACAKNRNKLMHGEITDLCSSDGEAETYAWEDYYSNFLELALVLPHFLPLLKGIINGIEMHFSHSKIAVPPSGASNS